MDKRILEEYIDACEVIKETEAEIHKLEERKSITANETVSGSNPEFPYNPQHFKVQGTTYSYEDDRKISLSMKALIEQETEEEEHETFDYKETAAATTGLGDLLKGLKL